MVSTSAYRPPLRLTRRGRAVVLAAFIMLASLASAVLFTTASRADVPAGPAVTVVVEPHDTLWSIATRTAPHRDPYAAIGEIRRLNGLRGYTVEPGEILVLPRSR